MNKISAVNNILYCQEDDIQPQTISKMIKIVQPNFSHFIDFEKRSQKHGTINFYFIGWNFGFSEFPEPPKTKSAEENSNLRPFLVSLSARKIIGSFFDVQSH